MEKIGRVKNDYDWDEIESNIRKVDESKSSCSGFLKKVLYYVGHSKDGGDVYHAVYMVYRKNRVKHRWFSKSDYAISGHVAVCFWFLENDDKALYKMPYYANGISDIDKDVFRHFRELGFRITGSDIEYDTVEQLREILSYIRDRVLELNTDPLQYSYMYFSEAEAMASLDWYKWKRRADAAKMRIVEKLGGMPADYQKGFAERYGITPERYRDILSVDDGILSSMVKDLEATEKHLK